MDVVVTEVEGNIFIMTIHELFVNKCILLVYVTGNDAVYLQGCVC